MNPDWFAAAPALVAAVAIAVLPGALALRAFGLKGLALLAAAPLVSVVVIALSGIALSAAGIGWSPLSAGAVLGIAVALAWVLRIPLRPTQPAVPTPAPRWLLPVALTAGGVIGAMRLTGYIGEPAGISQTNDAVFHMNAVRYIIEVSDASALSVSGVAGGGGFYPAAWHAIVSLVVMLTGADIAVAANAVTVAIGAVIWPLGIAWLARAVSGSQVVAAFAAVLSAALQTFPLLMFQWGVLFPNALSTALIPAAVAIVISLPLWNVPDGSWRNLGRAVLFVGVAVGALLFSQPAGLLPWAAISLVWMTAWLLTEKNGRSLSVRISAIVISWLALGAVWLVFSQSTSGSHWPPFRGKFEATVDVLTNGQMRVPISIVVSALMLIGVVVALTRRGLRWFAICWAGVSGLYVVLASVGSPVVRDVIFGAWYADPNRIAALAPIVVIPLAAIGFDFVVQRVTRLRQTDRPKGMLEIALPLAILVVFMVIAGIVRPAPMLDFPNDRFFWQSRYELDQTTYLDTNERQLLESLPDHVDPDDRVLGNPGTGTGFGYMLSGLDVYPRTWSPPTSAAWDVLAQRLRDVASDPEVCNALEVHDEPEYVLDFGIGSTEPGRYLMPGMTGFENRDGFELVAQKGDASLWRITACR